MSDFINVDTEIIPILKEFGVTNGFEIMLYCKIESMSSKTGYCTAGNRYFAGLFDMTQRGVQRYLLNLKTKGLIKTFEQRNGSHTDSRKIYPQLDKLLEESENEDTGEQVVIGSTNSCSWVNANPRQICAEPTTDTCMTHDSYVQNPRQGSHPVTVCSSLVNVCNCAPLRSADGLRPDVADAPGSADATQANLDRIKYFQSLSYDAMVDNKSLPRIVSRVYKDIDHDIHDPADDKKYLLKTFTGGFYQAKNTENITELIDAVLNNEIYFVD